MKSAVAALIFILLALRILLWRFTANSDLLAYFLRLQNYILAHGRWHALSSPIADYFPAYYDVATLLSYLDGHFNRITQIKLLSFGFDLLAAVAAYLIVRRITRDEAWASTTPKWAALLSVLAGPTVVINGSLWGQCDIVYTCFLLLSTYGVVSGSGAFAALMFGFALAFKLQAVFLTPFLAAMVLQGRIRWQHLLLIPVGWIVSLVPPLLVGANAIAYLELPFQQSKEYPALAINVGNPWMLAQRLHFSLRIGTLLGLAVTGVTFVAISLWGSRASFRSGRNTLMLAALSALALPYVMPRMHDRYFFAAEVLLSILTCIDFAFALPTLLVICASLSSYADYFLMHERPLATGAALVANTIALLLVLALVRQRVGTTADHGRDALIA